jgi:hypothetical protein
MNSQSSPTPTPLSDTEHQYREAMFKMFHGGKKNGDVSAKPTQIRPSHSITRSLHNPSFTRSRYIPGGIPSPHSAQQYKTPQAISFNFSLKLPRFSFSKLKNFATDHPGIIKKLCFATLSLVLLVGAVPLIKNFMPKDAPKVAGAHIIAPKTVFLPKPVPDGFTVGSSKQELENGAMLYTVFGPGGEEITINQQSSAPNFDQSILEGGFTFTTPHGTAYVLEGTDRITGYLLSDDSWVLLNNTDGLSPNDMEILINSLKPI